MKVPLSLLLTTSFRCAVAELSLAVYGNSAMQGRPSEVSQLRSLEFKLPRDRAYSAEVTGQLMYRSNASYAFRCSFSRAEVAIVWVDDHLICNSNPPWVADAWSTDGTQANPLMGRAGSPVPLVIHVYNSNVSDDSHDTLAISVEWAQLQGPVAHDHSVAWEVVPSDALLPGLPPLQEQRRELQQRMKQGWNLWSYNMLSVTKLPESCAITIALCQLSSEDCLLETHIEDARADIRVGMFATDLSYWQFYLGYRGLNVSMSYSGGARGLSFLAEPLGCSRGLNCSDYALVLMPSFKWGRAGDVSVERDNSSVTFRPLGQPAITALLTQPASAATLPRSVPAGVQALMLPLGAGAVGLQTGDLPGSSRTVGEIRSLIHAARAKEVARIAAFSQDREGGQRYATMEALQAATMWNYIYTPAEFGPILPVSRSWNFVKHATSSDWGYVIFDWDNIFASYMSSLDPTSKDIAYTNFIQVIRSRTAKGFVPNWAAGGQKTVDRTEPPIGAKVLLDMYRRHGDKWLVEFLFDDLLGWNDWFLRERLLQPAGLIAPGSSFADGYTGGGSTMQGARWESGLDNSPMYDGQFFNKSSGMMELYDVGMSAMFVQESVSLSQLARVIGRDALAEDLEARAHDMRTRISANLWDSEGGIFTNRFSNGTFHRRISPTSFYSMMAGAASDEQAIAMMRNWLTSPDHFCVSPSGDFAGNTDRCYWGLPSIDASDATFLTAMGAGGVYWRGNVWGPMAMLTFWSLQNYDHVREVRQARQALCKQMNALMLSQWRKNRHICENYSPYRPEDDLGGDCNGTRFYHWGALTGMISLIEHGFYNKRSCCDVVVI